MARTEIQSIEASCFVHGTEDEGRIVEAVKEFLGVDVEPSIAILEGHFGNKIVHLDWHLTGEQAVHSFGSMIRRVGIEGRSDILGNLGDHVDEHGSLYFRIKKQSLVSGTPLFSSGDPLRVKVKPRKFMVKGSIERFYRNLMEVASKN